MNKSISATNVSRFTLLYSVLFSAVLWSCPALAQTTIYVSPQGNDSLSGDSAVQSVDNKGPFATIERAQIEIRALKQRGELSFPVTVYLRGGVHLIDKPLRFTAGDSGSPGNPIVYSSYPGETAIISGGRPVSGWQYYRDGLWFVDLPEVANGDWTFDQLYVDGKTRPRSRIPNEGYFRVAELLDGTDFRTGTDHFRYAAGDIDPNWTNLTDVKVIAFHHWFDVHLPIKEVDSANRIVTFQMKASRNLIDGNQGSRYVVENVFEGLDSPGEWYLNRQTGRLFYMPLEGETPSLLEIFAPRLTELVLIDGTPTAPVGEIVFRGLTFEHNQWEPREWPDGTGDVSPAAVTITGGRRIQIEGCTFRNLETYAIDIWGASMYNTISTNLMEHLGAGGIKIGGATPEEDPAWRTYDNDIVNNTMRHLGERYPSSRGIFLMQTARNRVAHNEVSYLGYHGIQAGYHWGYGETSSSDNRIEYNHVHHVGYVRDQIGDLGGIYLNSEMPGTIVRNNLIHDIAGTHLAFGIYLDGYSSHLSIRDNVVHDTGDGGFILHFGKDNDVRNNVFAFGGEQRQVYLGKSKLSENLTFEQNIILWNHSTPLDGDLQGSHFRIDRNVYYRTDAAPILFGEETIDEWRSRGHDLASVIADPKISFDGKRLIIQDSSPALGLGFQPIDLSAVGPQTNQAPPERGLDSGDVNGDGQVTVSDIFYLINYLTNDGRPPVSTGDVSGDGIVNVSDVSSLVDLVFGA